MNRKRSLLVENLECRRVLAASLGWDGPGQGSAALSYYVGEAPSSLSQSEVNSAIETALDAWASVAAIDFSPTSTPGQRNSIDFTFRDLDGAGGTLAQAYFPDDVNPARIAGDVQFDSAEPWEIGNDLGSRAFDLVAVAVHEIGHSLGLDHIHESDSILSPTISPREQFAGLSTEDIAAIQQLYAAIVPSDDASSESDFGDETQLETENEAEVPPVDEPTESPERRFSPWSRFRWTVQFSNNLFRFGNRFRFQFGNFGSLEAGDGSAYNRAKPTDVNADSETSAVDALLVINAINSGKTLEQVEHFCDTNNDGALSAVDALSIINVLNNPKPTSTEAIPDSVTPDPTPPLTETDLSDPGLEQPGSDTVGEDESQLEFELDDTLLPEFEHDHSGEGHADEDCPDLLLADFQMARQFGSGRGLGLAFATGTWTSSPGPLERAADALFENFDSDSDGVLYADEVPDYLLQYLSDRGVDANDDAEITRTEIDEAIQAVRFDLFELADADEDGVLTSEEVPNRLWQRIRNADTDGSSGVSFEELEAFRLLSPFEQLDSNSDGGITSDEVSERRWERLATLDANEDSIVDNEEFASHETRIEPFSRLGRFASRAFRFAGRFR